MRFGDIGYPGYVGIVEDADGYYTIHVSIDFIHQFQYYVVVNNFKKAKNMIEAQYQALYILPSGAPSVSRLSFNIHKMMAEQDLLVRAIM